MAVWAEGTLQGGSVAGGARGVPPGRPAVWEATERGEDGTEKEGEGKRRTCGKRRREGRRRKGGKREDREREDRRREGRRREDRNKGKGNRKRATLTMLVHRTMIRIMVLRV